MIGVCTTGYCKNGGNCYVTEQGKPACDCPPGFLGHQCDKGNYCRIAKCHILHQFNYNLKILSKLHAYVKL